MFFLAGGLGLALLFAIATSQKKKPADANVDRSGAAEAIVDRNGVVWIIHLDPGLADQWLAEVTSDPAPYSPSLSATSKAHAIRRANEYAAAYAEPSPPTVSRGRWNR